MDLRGMPTLPDPDDLELLSEAALVATLNGRAEVVALLIDRGYPVDHRWWGDVSLLYFAIHYRKESVVEILLSRGADLDLDLSPQYSARELARVMVENSATSAELEPLPGIPRALKLASDDAIREGQTEVRADHLFIGLLRANEEFLLRPLASSGVDLLKLREMLTSRLFPADDGISRDPLSLDAEAQTVVARAKSIAASRQDEALNALHVVSALLENDDGFAAVTLVSAGANLPRLRVELDVGLAKL
jgi:hypothetical protein